LRIDNSWQGIRSKNRDINVFLPGISGTKLQ
jgi:hypothetical protein